VDPTQPTHQKLKNVDPTRPSPTQPNPAHGSTQPMDNSVLYSSTERHNTGVLVRQYSSGAACCCRWHWQLITSQSHLLGPAVNHVLSQLTAADYTRRRTKCTKKSAHLATVSGQIGQLAICRRSDGIFNWWLGLQQIYCWVSCRVWDNSENRSAFCKGTGSKQHYAQKHPALIFDTAYAQVSITAEQSSRLLTWNASQLRQYLTCDSHLAAAFDLIIGSDIASKLYSIKCPAKSVDITW